MFWESSVKAENIKCYLTFIFKSNLSSCYIGIPIPSVKVIMTKRIREIAANSCQVKSKILQAFPITETALTSEGGWRNKITRLN